MDRETGVKLVRISGDEKWAMVYAGGNYFFGEIREHLTAVRTPGGYPLYTPDEKLAFRILKDLEAYGCRYRGPESILTWHFSLIDNFFGMDPEEAAKMLERSFPWRDDWTYTVGQNDPDWVGIFGRGKERRNEIRDWLSACTVMQMTAASCIGSSYKSINLAYVLAKMTEHCRGSVLDSELKNLAELVERHSVFYRAHELTEGFRAFSLYYGMDRKEEKI